MAGGWGGLGQAAMRQLQQRRRRPAAGSSGGRQQRQAASSLGGGPSWRTPPLGTVYVWPLTGSCSGHNCQSPLKMQQKKAQAEAARRER